MYDTFAQSEAEFASAYLTCKLQRGGVPSVSQNELHGAALGLAITQDYGQRFPKLKTFNFANLPAVAEDMQNRLAIENDAVEKVGVLQQENRLLPTYDFQDVGDLTHATVLKNFLQEHNFGTATELSRGGKVASKYHTNAVAGAKYITDLLAEKYTNYETSHGSVPSLTQQTDNHFAETLGQKSALNETEKVFNRFNRVATNYLGHLMAANNGVAKISNQFAGNLAYNNWCHLLAGFPDLRRFIRDVEIAGKEFTMLLTPDSVQVTERQFAPHLVSQDQTDGYRHTQIDVLAKYATPTAKLQHCRVGGLRSVQKDNEPLRS